MAIPEASTDGDDVRADLPDSAAAPAEARALVRVAFQRWALPDLCDDVQLAVSELVTNAYQHGLPPVALRLRRLADAVRVDVSDARPLSDSREWSMGPRAGESGRGRGIVSALSNSCGVEETDGVGKSSYASWDVVPVAGP